MQGGMLLQDTTVLQLLNPVIWCVYHSDLSSILDTGSNLDPTTVISPGDSFE